MFERVRLSLWYLVPAVLAWAALVRWEAELTKGGVVRLLATVTCVFVGLIGVVVGLSLLTMSREDLDRLQQTSSQNQPPYPDMKP